MIYMDNHATTRVDPRVMAAMLPWFTEAYGNAGSITHELGRMARDRVAMARQAIAQSLGVTDEEIIFTSGATESNNLALRGIWERSLSPAGKRHIVSVVTEHRAVLDPLHRLAQWGAEITWLPVRPQGTSDAGRVDVDQLVSHLGDATGLVSIMLANNEIGVVQPLDEIVAACHARGIPVHCDATQAVGKIPLDLRHLPIDLLSFSAHKIYGPKGIGALVIRRQRPRIRIQPLLEGGGQEMGFRSGTLNVPGIVGFQTALEIALLELPTETIRLAKLRDELWMGLQQDHGSRVWLNGPRLDSSDLRLPGNLNVGFQGVLGETLMLHAPELAVSSGSACTAADPAPSHVLLALQLSPEAARSSLRFGLGRFNQTEEIVATRELLARAWEQCRRGSVS